MLPPPVPPAVADPFARLLLQHNLRQTPVRRAVLAALAGRGYALTGAEIEAALGPGTDRITLYRTLKSFEQNGLIHRVIDDTDVLRYAACSVECSARAHFDNHVHFKCAVCTHTYCLNQVAIPPVTLPPGFEAEKRDLLMTGICQACRTGA